MKFIPVDIPRKNSLADIYIHTFDRVASFYEYVPYRQESYSERLDDVLARKNRAKRSTLTGALQAYNARVNPHPSVKRNIDRLSRSDSVVVIGGQQAGALTGPLYTVYKAVTILQIARRQEDKLGVPVVPVYWIAGEDHDWEEVNHIWAATEGRLERISYGEGDGRKRSVGHYRLKAEDVQSFLKRVADVHNDSPFKREWLAKVDKLARLSETWSDWFARLFHSLFGEEGLVLIDTSAAEFKRAVAPFYTQWFAKYTDITRGVRETSRHIEQLGYRPQVSVAPDQMNVFLYEDGERSPLVKKGEVVVSQSSGNVYSEAELIRIAEAHPERLSANVVSRPLLQDYLFPTLAVVLGPGEIAYWGQFKQAFSSFGWKMPVLFPRTSFTLVPRDVEKTMNTFALTPDDALFRLDHVRDKWLKERDAIGIEQLFEAFRRKLVSLYETETAPLLSLGRHMDDVLAKNKARLLQEVQYLEKQANHAVRLRYGTALKQLERAEMALMPRGKLQERVYNLFLFINDYGWDWFHTFTRAELDLTRTHYMVYL